MPVKQSPVTVAYVAWAPFFSGAERALLVLVDNLDRSRYRPVVFVGTDGELSAELRARQICTIHLPIVYVGLEKLLSWSACVGRFYWHTRREGAALFHANDLPSFQPAGYAARLLGIPAISHLRFPDSRAGFEWFLRSGFSKALFISESLQADSTAEAPALFAGRSEVVYDGVRVPAVADESARRKLREELQLPIDRTVVVLAGQVAEVKGLWDYIEAAKILTDRGSTALFAVLGDDLKTRGALRLEAERVVREKGLADSVRFLGFRSNAPALMPAFDIVAVPSHVEPLGLSALEGMAAGRPVVGSRVGGIMETVVDGVTGTLVPARDPAALAAAIEALVADRGRAAAYGAAGRQRTLDRFSIDAHVTNIQSVYDTMLGSASTSTRAATTAVHR